MKVFLSWSGEQSRAVAEAVNELMKSAVQAVECFFSPRIERGKTWSDEIKKALQATRFGIVCLTPDNLDSPWIHYEAGALSKADDALIWTFLHQLEPSQVREPLSSFQHTVAQKDDIFELLKTINSRLEKSSERPVEPEVLQRNFDLAWPQMEERLKAAETKSHWTPLTRADFGNLASVEEVRTFVGDWYAITINGVHKLSSRKPVRSIDLLAVYRAGPMSEVADNIRDRKNVKVRVCLANMFDAKLNAVYRRLYTGKSNRQLRDAVMESIQKLLGPCTLEVRGPNNVHVRVKEPPKARFDVRLTNQRITLGYFRANDVASIMPLDMKTAQKPPPIAWLIDKQNAPGTFKHYLMQYEKMFDEAMPIYKTK